VLQLDLTDTEVLLRRVAVNHASPALQAAAARRDERRAAEQLEQRLADLRLSQA
jgi:hypothetical protein